MDKRHSTINRGTALLIAALTILCLSAPANAAFMIVLSESGGNVVANGSGSINTAALSSLGADGWSPRIQPGPASSAIIMVGQAATMQDWTGWTGPTSFGTGTSPVFASSSSGSLVGIAFANGTRLALPSTYVSGTSLTDSATWNSTTYAGLGVTPGTYTWTWGSGATADSLTLQIPEPTSTALLLGASALALLARRGKRVPQLPEQQ
jgi:hypothetical protein